MKATLRNAKKLVKALAAPGITFDVDGETVTVWYDGANYDAAETITKIVAKALGDAFWGYYTGKFIVYYKRPPVDRGDFNNPSSKWHY